MCKANINQFITTQGGTSCKHGDMRKNKLNHNHVKKEIENILIILIAADQKSPLELAIQVS